MVGATGFEPAMLANLIYEYASSLALQMGIKLSKVSITDGQPMGCQDACLLHLTAKSHGVDTMIYTSELESLEKGIRVNDRLEARIMSALSRLQLMLEP